MSLLTVKAVSERLQVKPSTVYLWAAQGTIPHLKLGRLLRFDRDEIEHWLLTCRHGVQAQAEAQAPAPRRRRAHYDHVDDLIAQAKRDTYTSSRGKPDQDRATGKGDKNGSV
jgi:excisionase family DNA binding protein